MCYVCLWPLQAPIESATAFQTPTRLGRSTAQSPTSPQSTKVSFFSRIGRDIDIVKTVLLLTGAFHGTSHQVQAIGHAKLADCLLLATSSLLIVCTPVTS